MQALTALLTRLVALISCAVLAGAAGASPRPAQARSPVATYLNGVSCPDTQDCWAVGDHTHVLGQPVTAIERLQGGTWSAVPSPEPAGARDALFAAVSCTSAQACLAVGYYGLRSGATFPLAARWDGTRWSLVTVPAAGSTSAVLNGVTCLRARDCWAVGYDRQSGLAEHWNGTAWSISAVPGRSGSSLAGVSCTGARNCWAAGTWNSSSGSRYGSVTMHWNGQAWSAVSTPTSRASNSRLYAASCPPGGACLTVGYEDGHALAQRWSGSAWLRTADPAGTSTALSGDACGSGSACLAVGARNIGPQAVVTFAAQWNGMTWSVLTVPSPAHWIVSGLQGIACPAAADCWAVGGSLNPGAPGRAHRIIEHWNGTTWTLVG